MNGRRKRVVAPAPVPVSAVPPMPEMPRKTEAELVAERELIASMKRLTAQLHQRNLDNAVLLAQMAAAGRLAAMGEGGLADHFAELGRRFVEMLDQPVRAKPHRRLRLIDGGAA